MIRFWSPVRKYEICPVRPNAFVFKSDVEVLFLRKWLILVNPRFEHADLTRMSWTPRSERQLFWHICEACNIQPTILFFWHWIRSTKRYLIYLLSESELNRSFLTRLSCFLHHHHHHHQLSITFVCLCNFFLLCPNLQWILHGNHFVPSPGSCCFQFKLRFHTLPTVEFVLASF